MTQLGKYYSKKTKYKKLGDALLLVCPLLVGVALELPLSDNAIKWILVLINLGTIVGKLLLSWADSKETERNEKGS